MNRLIEPAKPSSSTGHKDPATLIATLGSHCENVLEQISKSPMDLNLVSKRVGGGFVSG